MAWRPLQQFSEVFWDVFDPPRPSEHQKKKLVRLQNFLKMTPEISRFSENEPRKRGSEPRFRGSKTSGISRVKNS